MASATSGAPAGSSTHSAMATNNVSKPASDEDQRDPYVTALERSPQERHFGDSAGGELDNRDDQRGDRNTSRGACGRELSLRERDADSLITRAVHAPVRPDRMAAASADSDQAGGAA